jgi:TRAP transporter TAXI family solute receptor
MKLTKLGAFALTTALVSTSAFADGHIDRTGWPESFTLGTASQGGTYFAYGSGWANLVADELGISGGAEVTGGPMQNMALVHTGEAQFGMTTMGPAADSIAGNNPIAPGLQMTGACAMFPMYQTPFYIAALASSGINSVSDIPDGALMGFGPAGSTADTYFPRMMESLGASFERRNGGFNDMGSQLQDGLLDVWGVAGGIPTPAISQLEASTEITIIEMNEEELASILDNFPVTPFSMPADTYEALDADSPAVSMWNFAIANCELPDSFVYSVVDVIMADNERMVNIHRAATATLPENWNTNNGVMMWHPGAAQWFTENAGAEIPADQIFGG